MPGVLLRQHVSSALAGPLPLSSSESGLPPSPSEIFQVLPHQDPPWASCSLGVFLEQAPLRPPHPPRLPVGKHLGEPHWQVKQVVSWPQAKGEGWQREKAPALC